MPYSKRAELPDSAKDKLPAHAQDIYKATFESAWKQYGLGENDESRAHAMAWNAVKKHYHQADDGTWIEGATEQSHEKRGLDERLIF